jgi:PIN domain nuclease of toxin-antitoxin system
MIVLDTHVLIWWVSGDERLSPRARMAIEQELLGVFHADPADRMIVALARHHSAPLLTADARMQAYPHVKTIW